MANKPTPHSSFTVTSGCLSYGLLHNMCHGLTMPIQPFPTTPQQLSGWTAMSQTVHYNTAAQNGIWRAYELIDTRTQERTAWFVCHDTVNPESEVDKILRVSGSPCEHDSGSMWHDDKTVEEGILPINRYDWGWYDERCQGQVPDLQDLHCPFEGEDVGLVDFGHTMEYIGMWKHVRSLKRESQAHGIWMNVMQEHKFGRFGFTNDRKAARSFLWFTIDTRFAFTAFAGTERTLRTFESEEDRANRQLRDGYNLDGVELIQELAKRGSRGLPPDGELCGPYDTTEYILDAEDAEAINAAITKRTTTGQPPAHFSPYWKDACLEVMNELVMSYLERLVASTRHLNIGNTFGLESVAASLFPKHDQAHAADEYMYATMADPHSSVSAIDRAAFAGKVTTFLVSRGGSDGGIFREESVAQGLAAAVECLISDILEWSCTYSWGSWCKGAIVPRHIRGSIIRNGMLLEMLRYSRVYWMGGTNGWVDAGQDS